MARIHEINEQQRVRKEQDRMNNPTHPTGAVTATTKCSQCLGKGQYEEAGHRTPSFVRCTACNGSGYMHTTTASVGSPSPIPPRPVLYACIKWSQSQGEWVVRVLSSSPLPSSYTDEYPGSVIVTIPSDSQPTAERGKEEPGPNKSDWCPTCKQGWDVADRLVETEKKRASLMERLARRGEESADIKALIEAAEEMVKTVDSYGPDDLLELDSDPHPPSWLNVCSENLETALKALGDPPSPPAPDTRLREDLETLAKRWDARARESHDEANRIHRTVKGTTDAEERCRARSVCRDDCARELRAALTPTPAPSPEKPESVTETCPVCHGVNDADKEHNCGTVAEKPEGEGWREKCFVIPIGSAWFVCAPSPAKLPEDGLRWSLTNKGRWSKENFNDNPGFPGERYDHGSESKARAALASAPPPPHVLHAPLNLPTDRSHMIAKAIAADDGACSTGTFPDHPKPSDKPKAEGPIATAVCTKCGWSGVGELRSGGIQHHLATGCRYLALPITKPESLSVGEEARKEAERLIREFEAEQTLPAGVAPPDDLTERATTRHCERIATAIHSAWEKWRAER